MVMKGEGGLGQVNSGRGWHIKRAGDSSLYHMSFCNFILFLLRVPMYIQFGTYNRRLDKHLMYDNNGALPKRIE